MLVDYHDIVSLITVHPHTFFVVSNFFVQLLLNAAEQ
jgi:hypothetical protein